MDEYSYYNWSDFSSYIVPPILEGPSSSGRSAPSYEQPWWADTINRAIERGAQVASVATAGYPQYPQYPTPSPTPMPVPLPGVAPQTSGAGIQLSTNTLMVLGLVGFALLVGRRGR